MTNKTTTIRPRTLQQQISMWDLRRRILSDAGSREGLLELEKEISDYGKVPDEPPAASAPESGEPIASRAKWDPDTPLSSLVAGRLHEGSLREWSRAVADQAARVEWPTPERCNCSTAPLTEEESGESAAPRGEGSPAPRVVGRGETGLPLFVPTPVGGYAFIGELPVPFDVTVKGKGADGGPVINVEVDTAVDAAFRRARRR